MKMKALLFIVILLGFVSSQAAIVVGNPNGVVELTEIYDYQCPHCRAMEGVIDVLIENNSTLKVRLLPVAIMNEQSVIQAAYAVSRALYHNDIEETHDAFMVENFSKMETIHGYIEDKNTSSKEFNEIYSKKVKETINEGYQLMEKLNLHETPIIILQPLSHSKQPVVLAGEHSYQELNGIISTITREELTHGKTS